MRGVGLGNLPRGRGVRELHFVGQLGQSLSQRHHLVLEFKDPLDAGQVHAVLL